MSQSTAAGGALISLTRALLRRAEVDRAVGFALLTSAWQIVAGPITLLLIAPWFTLEVQGFYYTFASLQDFMSGH